MFLSTVVAVLGLGLGHFAKYRDLCQACTDVIVQISCNPRPDRFEFDKAFLVGAANPLFGISRLRQRRIDLTKPGSSIAKYQDDDDYRDQRR